MKFAHMADLHLGGWRDPKLGEISLKAFEEAVRICIDENVGFIIIAGDFFDSALPSVDLLKSVAEILDLLKSKDIEVYVVSGSHDFSPSGKTMIEVLEKAGLCKNVFQFEGTEKKEKLKLKFVEDKTGVKLAGMIGKRGGLEKHDYEILDKKSLEKEDGFKVFVFHTALDEFKPAELEKMESLPLAALPKNFSYYAGGHVHSIFEGKKDDGLVVYPGALFPNNFLELEKFGYGGFYIVDDKLRLSYKEIKLYGVVNLKIGAWDKDIEEIKEEILKKIEDVEGKIVTLRINGVLKSGKPSDLNFKEIFQRFYDSGAYAVLKNTAKLKTKEFKELKVEGSVYDIEENVIKEHVGQIKVMDFEKDEEKILTKQLMDVLNKEKGEGERVIDFEKRIFDEALKVLKLKWKNATEKSKIGKY